REEFVRASDHLAALVALDVFGAFAGHLDVAAQRQRPDAVLGVAAPNAHHRRIESELELEHADADPLRGEKMPQFVYEHEDAQHESKGQQCRQRLPQTFNSNPRAMSCACARAAASTERTVARVLTSAGRCASIARAITCGIAVKPIRPSRNRATAISFAAFRTTGRLRSASSARYARRRHGNASVSGTSKSRRPLRTRSSGGTGAVQRSGYENAYLSGSRMSLPPSCASNYPLVNSTIECTTACG